MKTCPCCQKEFRPNPSQPTQKFCSRKCGQRDSMRRYRAKNPEKAREISRRWATANPEKVRERNRRYYAANSEKLKKNAQLWDAANSEKKREINRRWREANREKARASSLRYFYKISNAKLQFQFNTIHLWKLPKQTGYGSRLGAGKSVLE